MPSASDLTHSSPKSSVCDLSLLAKLQEAEKIHEELAVREALRNNLYWLTRATKTRDEQNPADPYKPFPDKKYIRAIFQFLDEWPGRLKIIEKSRTMMGSWSVSEVAEDDHNSVELLGVEPEDFVVGVRHDKDFHAGVSSNGQSA